MGDAIGDDPRLAAARARQNEHRPIRGLNGFALLRIQFVEERQFAKSLTLLRFSLLGGLRHLTAPEDSSYVPEEPEK